MEDNNYQQTKPLSSGNVMDTEVKEPSRYWLGLAAGIISSAVLGALAAEISILLGSVYIYIMGFAAAVLGAIIHGICRRPGIITGLIAAICSAASVVVFTYVIEAQDYVWDDGSSISSYLYITMAIAFVLGGWIGFKDWDASDK